MSYFTKFKKITYENKRVVDIFSSIMMKYRLVENNKLYFKYTIVPGEKPEDVSQKFYNDPKLHWIILLMNRIVDPQFDWYLDARELDSVIQEKYGDDKYDVHHFVYVANGEQITDYEDYIAREWFETNGEYPHEYSPITNYEYEVQKNDEKQIINVISDEHMPRIKRTLYKMLDDEYIYLTKL